MSFNLYNFVSISDVIMPQYNQLLKRYVNIYVMEGVKRNRREQQQQ